MNAVDATDREAQSDNGIPASLLTIILDTNPHAWALLGKELPLSKVVANLLVFINAHLAINNANKVAVIASHTQRAQWLYPTPSLPDDRNRERITNGVGERGANGSGTDSQPPEDANKYRPFAHIEHTLTSNLRALISSTLPSELATPATMIAGALTMALSYISKAIQTAPISSGSGGTYDSNTGSFVPPDQQRNATAASASLSSRILILSVSGDLSHQYIPMMNAIFACQRIHCPIDILKLAGDAVFLQQAADATGGVYMSLSAADAQTEGSKMTTTTTQQQQQTARRRPRTAGILQYLMQAYLPDPSARNNLYPPGQSHGVDFRAACFCHRRVVDLGFVCSICLSIFCEPLADDICLTCGTALSIGNYGTKPVVVARKKVRKKKRLIAADGREGTPMSGAETPGP